MNFSVNSISQFDYAILLFQCHLICWSTVENCYQVELWVVLSKIDEKDKPVKGNVCLYVYNPEYFEYLQSMNECDYS